MLKTKQEKLVDLVLGPDAYRDIPNLVKQVEGGQKAVNVLLSREETYAEISPVRLDSNGVTAFISIMRGCDNMCSFCVVPFTRGRERSRNPQSILEEASEQIRDLSHNLIPAVLLKFGLGFAVQDLCEKLSNSKITFTSNAKNIERFNQNFEIKMFNIINELVNNIIKHSKAKKGTIKLEQLNGNLQVIVFDDGIGFDINEIELKNGIGLSLIKARIKVLNGLLNIKSTNEGTRIFISVPIEY